jgi:hypothetical protein
VPSRRWSEEGFVVKNSQYAETVIAQVHSKTLQGELQWKTNANWIKAEPTSAIFVMIHFYEMGPTLQYGKA